MQNEHEYMTVNEAAAAAKICRSMFYRVIGALPPGTVRTRKLGRRTLISKADWMAYLADLPAAEIGRRNTTEAA